jgi:hypothetical protein
MFTYVNVDSDTLEVELSKTRGNGLAVPVDPKAGKIWEAVSFNFMYPTVYAGDRKKAINRRYSLADAPLWLTTIAAIMWEGVIQGASWDIVKLAVRSALAKLSDVGLAPTPGGHKSKETSVRAGWREYSQPGRKQCEMFLTIRKTVRTLPERHAIAYSRAKDDLEFGRIIRGQVDPLLAQNVRTRSRSKANHKKA